MWYANSYGIKMNESLGSLVDVLKKIRDENKTLEENDMKSGQYVIGSIVPATSYNPEAISLSSAPRTHTAKTAALGEAERLARLEPGKRFVVLKLEGIVVAQQTVWS